MFMRAGMGVYTGKTRGEMSSKDPMGNGIHLPAQIINSRSTGKANPDNRAPKGTISIIPTVIIYREEGAEPTGLLVTGLLEEDREEVEEGDSRILIGVERQGYRKPCKPP